ncbi:MAG: TrmH family RNA methyltransferase [Propionibacteriaceae bacterium]|nr:TrmH family RNA methyltransferase [Propionibacteriaceae bacterium]
MSGRVSTPTDLRRSRRRTQHGCWGQLIVAPLWVAYHANLGTLQRTCDAVGACLAVPDTPHYRDALNKGNTLGRRRPCLHRVAAKEAWVGSMQDQGWRVVAVELAEGATPLPRLQPARQPTIVLLGHEHHGVPATMVEVADECVEIPMCGVGASLNVAVAGSLVLYRLAGLA